MHVDECYETIAVCYKGFSSFGSVHDKKIESRHRTHTMLGKPTQNVVNCSPYHGKPIPKISTDDFLINPAKRQPEEKYRLEKTKQISKPCVSPRKKTDSCETHLDNSIVMVTHGQFWHIAHEIVEPVVNASEDIYWLLISLHAYMHTRM